MKIKYQISRDQIELIRVYKKLSDEDKKKVLEYAKMLTGEKKYYKFST